MKKRLAFIPKWAKLMIPVGLLFFGFSLLFPAGFFAPASYLDDFCEYSASLAKNHTTSGTYLSMVVEPKSFDRPMGDTRDDFTSLYGVFRENKASFAGTVNAERSHTIFLPEVYGEDRNLAFLYVTTPGFTNVEYKGAWKHEYYPIQLMFKGVSKSPGTYSFCYLPRSYADVLLRKSGLELTTENYESLLGKTVDITIDGASYTWTIGDIYLEVNYYYEAVHETIGDFLLVYNRFPDDMKKQALFLLTDYGFQNKFITQYANGKYNFSDYEYFFGTNNIVTSTEVDQSVFAKMNAGGNLVGLSLLLALSLCFLVAGLVFTWLFAVPESLSGVVALAASAVLPLGIFALAFLFHRNWLWFSSFTRECYLFALLVTVLLVFIWFLMSSARRSKREGGLEK